MLTFKAHTKPVYGLAFSPDGRFLLTSSGDETVKLWEYEGLKLVRELPGSKFAAPVALSPDDRFIARGGYGVEVWETGSGESVISTPYPETYADTLAFAPDGKEIAASGSGKSLKRWSLPRGSLLPTSSRGMGQGRDASRFPAGAVAYSPDGSLIATSFGVNTYTSAGYASHVCLWDRKGTLRGELKAEHTHGHPTSIVLSPDGSLLAGIYGPILQVFNVRTKAQIATHKPDKKHFKGLTFTPNGKRLVIVSNDKSVRLYDTKSWTEVTGYEWKVGRLGCVAVAADGLRMAAGSDSGKVVVWDVDL
jgi:WD40 repeat protein